MKPTVSLLHEAKRLEWDFKVTFEDLIGITNQITYHFDVRVDTKSFIKFQGPIVANVDHMDMARNLVENHARTRVSKKTLKFIADDLRKHIPERIQVI